MQTDRLFGLKWIVNRYGNMSATYGDVQSAIKASGLENTIRRLEHGLQTEVRFGVNDRSDYDD